jgi:tetratricopeptide (TPR) repeat protein
MHYRQRVKHHVFWLTLLLAAAPVSLPAQSGSQAPAITDAATEARLQALESRYRRSIALAPEAAAYHADLAEVLRRRGRYDEARAEYETAVQLDEYSSRNRALLGQFLLQQGDAGAAVGHLRAAVKADPRSAPYAELLASAYAKQGEWRAAAEAMQRAVELVPADSQYRRQLRHMRAQAGIAVDAPIATEQASVAPARPVLLRAIELTLGTLLALAGVALVYPIVCGIILAGRTGIHLLAAGDA